MAYDLNKISGLTKLIMIINKIVSRYRGNSKRFSDSGLTKKAYLNAFSTLLDFGARLVVGFVVNPILVSGLGDYGYGIWQILGRLIGYIGPASGRPEQALKWTIANQQASTDYEEKRRLVGSALTVAALCLPLLLLLGSTLAFFAPVWLDAPAEWYFHIRLATALLVANLIMISFVDVPQAVLRGENLHYKRIGLSVVLIGVGGGLTVLALYLDAGLVGVAAATLATTLLTGALFYGITRAYVPWFGIAKPYAGAVKRFAGLTGWFLAWAIVMRMILASDVVILGLVDSAEIVTRYTLSKYIPVALIYLVIIIRFGIVPGLGRAVGSGDFQKAARVRNEMMLFSWFIATVAGVMILLWNRSFIQLWVGDAYNVDPISTLLIMLMLIQQALFRVDADIINLTLNIRRKVLIGGSAASISIVLAWVFIDAFKMGIPGLCLGFVIGRSIMTIAYPQLIGSLFGITLMSQFKSCIRPALITSLLFILALIQGAPWIIHTWIDLILSAGVTLLIVSTFVFYIGLSTDHRNRMLQRMRELIRFTTLG